MTKQFRKYDDFSGGINSNSDPRDIGTNEVTDAYNVMFDKKGMIRTQGQLATPDLSPASPTKIALVSGFKHTPGYGLLTFGVDYLPVDYTATPTYNPGRCIAYMGMNSTTSTAIVMRDSLGGEKLWTWGFTATPPYPVAYYTNGALRIHDAGFVNSKKWIAYINTTLFESSGAPEVVNDWFGYDTFLSAPTYGIVSDGVIGTGAAGSNATTIVCSELQDYDITGSENYVAVSFVTSKARDITAQGGSPYSLTTDTIAGDSWEGDIYSIYPPTGTGFNVSVTATSGGTWLAKTLEFASTLIYFGNQESVLHKVPGSITISDNDKIEAQVLLHNGFSKSVIGGRIYCRESGTSDPWTLFLDIDLSKGVRGHLEDSFTIFSNNNATGSGHAPTNNYMMSETGLYLENPDTNTYESLNGWSQDTTNLSIDAKHFCIGHNRAWATNIKTVNKSGATIYIGDRVMYTPPGKYDTWPELNFLDIGLNDGDEGVAVAAFADKLLVFKRNRLYIVNVSGVESEWFMESQHEHLGVTIPGAVYKTDYGVVWVNDTGCYWYNGNAITNLLEKNSNGVQQLVIHPTVWGAFVTDYAIVGFDPEYRQIVVLGDSSSKNGYIYIYDMSSGAWTRGNRFAVSSGQFSNFQTWWDHLIISRSYGV